MIFNPLYHPLCKHKQNSTQNNSALWCIQCPRSELLIKAEDKIRCPWVFLLRLPSPNLCSGHAPVSEKLGFCPYIIHPFFYKNVLIFAKAWTLPLLFLNFHCFLTILSLNILIDCILQQITSVKRVKKIFRKRFEIGVIAKFLIKWNVHKYERKHSKNLEYIPTFLLQSALRRTSIFAIPVVYLRAF